MTLQQQAIQAIQVLPDEKLPALIQFAHSLQKSPSAKAASSTSIKQQKTRKLGRLKGKIWMAEDFNDTPAEFAEYI